MTKTKEIKIEPISNPNFEELSGLVRWMEPNLSREIISERLQTMRRDGSTLVGVWLNHALVGLAVFSLRTHCFSGLVMYAESVVLTPETRGLGLGKRLMQWLETTARSEGCKLLTLDAYVRNTDARAFYEKLGFDPRGVHFVREIE